MKRLIGTGWKIVLTLGLPFCAALLAGCLVDGRPERTDVAVWIEIDDRPLKPAAGFRLSRPDSTASEMEAGFAAALQVDVEADDFEEALSGKKTIPTGQDTSTIELELEMSPGAGRSFGAILFLIDGDSLKGYATEEPMVTDIKAANNSVTLTVAQLPAATAIVQVNGTTDEEWRLFFKDEATGFELPSWPCVADDDHLTCRARYLPVSRRLIPGLRGAEGRTLSFEESLTLTRENEENDELVLSVDEE